MGIDNEYSGDKCALGSNYNILYVYLSWDIFDKQEV